jgi:hypothetical protein
MNFSLYFGAMALIAASTSAGAFTISSDGVPVSSVQTRLTDPDDIINQMNRQNNGGGTTVTQFGGTRLDLSGHGDNSGAENAFAADPAAGTVMSKRQW